MQSAETLLDRAIHFLEIHGLAVNEPEAVDLLESSNLARGRDGTLIRFRTRAVRTRLCSLPSAFNLYDREGRKSATVAAGSARPSGPALQATIPGAAEEDGLRAVDLPRAVRRITQAGAFDLIGVAPLPTDLPPGLGDTYSFYLHLLATDRPLLFHPRHPESLDGIQRLLSEVRGCTLSVEEKPLAILDLPLDRADALAADQGRLLIDGIRRGFPLALRPRSGEPQGEVADPDGTATHPTPSPETETARGGRSVDRSGGFGHSWWPAPDRLVALAAGMLVHVLIARECRASSPLLWGLPLPPAGRGMDRWAAWRLLFDVGHVLGLPTYAALAGAGLAETPEARVPLALGASLAGARLVAWGGPCRRKEARAAGGDGKIDVGDTGRRRQDGVAMLRQVHALIHGSGAAPPESHPAGTLIPDDLRIALAAAMRQEAARFDALHLPLSV
jgi:hypothetical protein